MNLLLLFEPDPVGSQSWARNDQRYIPIRAILLLERLVCWRKIHPNQKQNQVEGTHETGEESRYVGRKREQVVNEDEKGEGIESVEWERRKWGVCYCLGGFLLLFWWLCLAGCRRGTVRVGLLLHPHPVIVIRRHVRCPEAIGAILQGLSLTFLFCRVWWCKQTWQRDHLGLGLLGRLIQTPGLDRLVWWIL